jgi:DNA-binding PadR family transcriptional regulator
VADHPSGLERITQPTLDVLEALLDADDFQLHGWAIMKATRRAGPTVYKILERLAHAHWVTARWEDRADEPNRPRRRFYRLTPDGAVRARALLVDRRPEAARRLRPAYGRLSR